jgi:hypothetical protein
MPAALWTEPTPTDQCAYPPRAAGWNEWRLPGVEQTPTFVARMRNYGTVRPFYLRFRERSQSG